MAPSVWGLNCSGVATCCVCEQCHAVCTPDLRAVRRVSCDVGARTYSPELKGIVLQLLPSAISLLCVAASHQLQLTCVA
jgi:hypothetical protein